MISFCNLIGGALSEPPEVNGLTPPMLPGSFAERGNEPGDEANPPVSEQESMPLQVGVSISTKKQKKKHTWSVSKHKSISLSLLKKGKFWEF